MARQYYKKETRAWSRQRQKGGSGGWASGCRFSIKTLYNALKGAFLGPWTVVPECYRSLLCQTTPDTLRRYFRATNPAFVGLLADSSRWSDSYSEVLNIAANLLLALPGTLGGPDEHDPVFLRQAPDQPRQVLLQPLRVRLVCLGDLLEEGFVRLIDVDDGRLQKPASEGLGLRSHSRWYP